VRIGVPFNEPFSSGSEKAVGHGKASGSEKAVGHGKASDLCVKACPTGALSFR
jgi:ferredoxin